MDNASFSMPVAAVLPAIIGAIATITAALIQLAIGWRKEMRARENHIPPNKRTRRGVVGAIVVLMIGSAVGGFSLSQYLVSESRKEALEMDREIRARLEQLTAIAQRLERSTVGARPGEATAASASETSPQAALPAPTCLQGDPPVERPCAELRDSLQEPAKQSAVAGAAEKK